MFLLCLLLLVETVIASHYRGGTMSYSVRSDSNNVTVNGQNVAVRITQRHSWRRSAVFCNNTDPISGNILQGGTLLVRQSVPYPLREIPLISASVRCTDYNEEFDFSSGENSTTVMLPLNQRIDYIYASCCWITLLPPDSASNWSLKFVVNTYRRRNGAINNSPKTSMNPVVEVQVGKTHIIRIPMADSDGDTIQCRWGKTIDECGSVCAAKGTLRANPCELTYNARQLGYHGVALVIEDFDENNNVISAIPLQFLIHIVNINTTIEDNCTELPTYIGERSPGSCIGIQSNTTFYTSIQIRIPCANTSITLKDILTVSPAGLIKGNIVRDLSDPNLYRMPVQWTPTSDQYGIHQLCLTPVDSKHRTGVQTCLTFQVDIRSPEIIQVAPRGLVSATQSIWIINLDRDIIKPKRPNEIFIRFFKRSSRREIYRIDIATNNHVVYQPRQVTFFTINNTWERGEEYYILVDSGVGILNESCGVESIPISNSSTWTFQVEKEDETTLADELITTEKSFVLTSERLAVKTTKRSAAETTEQSSAEISEEPAAETTEGPGVKTTKRSAVETTEQSSAETSEEPVADTTEEPGVKTTKRLAAETTEQSSAEISEEPVAETTEEPGVKTTKRSVAETTEQSSAEISKEPVAETTEEPGVKTTKRSAAETTEQSSAEISKEPVAETTEEPGVKTTKRSVAETTEQSSAEISKEPVAETTEEPGVKTTKRSAAETTEQSSAEISKEPVAETTEEPGVKTTKRSVAETTEQSSAEISKEPVAETTEEPGVKTTKRSVAETTEQSSAEISKEPVAETTEEPGVKTTKRSAAETTEQSSAEISKEPVAETTEEPGVKTTKRSAAETTEQSSAEISKEPVAETTEEPSVETTKRLALETTKGLVVVTTEQSSAQTTEEPSVETTKRLALETTKGLVAATTEQSAAETTEGPNIETTERLAVKTTKRPVEATTERLVVMTTEESSSANAMSTSSSSSQSPCPRWFQYDRISNESTSVEEPYFIFCFSVKTPLADVTIAANTWVPCLTWKLSGTADPLLELYTEPDGVFLAQNDDGNSLVFQNCYASVLSYRLQRGDYRVIIRSPKCAYGKFELRLSAEIDRNLK